MTTGMVEFAGIGRFEFGGQCRDLRYALHCGQTYFRGVRTAGCFDGSFPGLSFPEALKLYDKSGDLVLEDGRRFRIHVTNAQGNFTAEPIAELFVV
jgi:hypothetical protein